jgi:hypothetical protein
LCGRKKPIISTKDAEAFQAKYCKELLTQQRGVFRTERFSAEEGRIMETSKANSNLVLATLVGGLFVGLLSGGAQSQNLNNKVLVIDEGVDLQHSELRNRSYVNTAELYGQKTVDDDRNGFVDDVSGWNILSNDNQYFPAWLKKTFEDNASTTWAYRRFYSYDYDGGSKKPSLFVTYTE